MKLVDGILRADGWLGGMFDVLQAPFALFARWYVGWQFFHSGILKVTSWETTLSLFVDEYHVPLLPPHAAAVLGAAGELLFPTLLFAGFMGRFGALGLFAVNAVAVVSYRHVLFEEGFEAALGQHVLWGAIALYLLIHGPGWLSLDALLRRMRRTAAQPAAPVATTAARAPRRA